MSLRKSPRLTPALLAANRRNARKSTGPRTARGRERTLLNGLRAGRRSCLLDTLARAPLAQQLNFSHIYAMLYKSLSRAAEGPDEVLTLAARAWWTKRKMEAWVRSAEFRADVAAHEGWLPEPWRMKIDRGISCITVTVWVRCGRAGPARWRYVRNLWPAGCWDGKRPLYVGVTVRHNGLRSWQAADGPLPCSVKAHRALRELRAGAGKGVLENATSPERNVTSRGDVTSPGREGTTVKARMSHFISKLRSYLHRNSHSGTDGQG